MERGLAQLLVWLLGPYVVRIDHALAAWWKRIRSNGWPTTEARVHQVTISGNGYYWHGNLSYSYSVAGEFYSGFFIQQFARERDADAFAAKFPDGLPFQVHYHPTRSDVSIATYEELYRAADMLVAVSTGTV